MQFLYGINNGDFFKYTAVINTIPRLYNDMLTVEGICTEQNHSLSSCMIESKQITKSLYVYSIQVERQEKPISVYWSLRFQMSFSSMKHTTECLIYIQ